MFNFKPFTLNSFNLNMFNRNILKRGPTLAILALVVAAISTPWAISQQGGELPAYNAAPPAKGQTLPPILGKEQLWGENAQYSFQSHAYELAAKIPAVLHQEPCYCYCDRGMGHNSLHSCFEGTHGAQCSVCLKEAYYAYSMTRKKKTPAQIRQGIIKGEWKQIDLHTTDAIN
jgi:hypothetical protein